MGEAHHIQRGIFITPSPPAEFAALAEKYSSQGLVIMAFPCNQARASGWRGKLDLGAGSGRRPAVLVLGVSKAGPVLG